MEQQSRREFIRSCLYLAVSGMAGCCIRRPLDAAALEAPAADGMSAGYEPPYIQLHRNGELKKRGETLWNMMRQCSLCPRECGARRLDGERGFCQASAQLEIASYNPHFGEEKPLVGVGGSGTIFFANCALRCVFCINWQVSHEGAGSPRSIPDLAGMMLKLQDMGCHNVNVVTPTHYSPHILLALDQAAAGGLKLPLVYNTCGWERLEILKMLDGVADIYLPDFKYSAGDMAAKYSAGAAEYPEVTMAALKEMHRQVGVARPGRDGLVRRGLMIRHLVMPNNVGGSKQVFEWIAQNLPKDTYVNVMSQYTPYYKAFEYPEISRRITRREYDDAVRWAKEAGLSNLDIQG
ncbi:MAG TPA: radical SAM protein [Planctomycetes bacterium]|nr:radical SAM protein [Planctomycetota bacterium]